jgi:hypothetical protein
MFWLWVFAFFVVSSILRLFKKKKKEKKNVSFIEDEKLPQSRKLIMCLGERLFLRAGRPHDPLIDLGILEKDPSMGSSYEVHKSPLPNGASFKWITSDFSDLSSKICDHFDGRYEPDQIVFVSQKLADLKGIPLVQCQIIK